MKFIVHKIYALSLALLILVGQPGYSFAWTHGVASQNSSFNNGKFQTHLNFTAIGGNYAFIDELKDSTGWGYADNSGSPDPSELDANGYPLPGANAFSHSGVSKQIRIPSSADAGNARIFAVTGKGTVSVSTTGVLIPTIAAVSVATGANTSIAITGTPTYSFFGGMEIPLSGTVTGVTLGNATGTFITPTGAQTAWTICASYNGASLTLPLCLNDAVTPLQTSGTASGAPTISYGRFAVGVPTNGRVIVAWAGSPPQITVGITATDATTPITLLAMMQPKWEAQWHSCSLPGKYCFSPDLISLLQSSKPAWLRDLNLVTASSGSVLTDQVNWETRKPLTYHSYAASYAVSTSWAGATTSTNGVTAGNDYQISFGSGAPAPGSQFILKFNADAVTLNSAATPATISWPSHNLSVGSAFNIFSGTAPAATATFTGQVIGSGNQLQVSGSSGTLISATTISGSGFSNFQILSQASGTVGGDGVYNICTPSTSSCGTQATTSALAMVESYTIPSGVTNYFVSSVVDANTIQFSPTFGGQSALLSSAGAQTFAHQTTVMATNVAVTGAPTTSLTWPSYVLSLNDPINCSNPVAPLNSVTTYYVKSFVDANNITVSATPGGSAITLTANGSSIKCIREPTLNLNGAGALPIRGYSGGGVSVTSRTDTPQYATGGRAGIGPTVLHASVVYDPVLNVWEKTGADQSLGNQYIANWWPPEVFLELCKEVGANPWFVTPAYTADQATNWLPSLMAYVRDNKAPWQIGGFEGPNEDWNNGFFDTQYTANHGIYYNANLGWATGSVYQVYGKMMSTIGQTAANVFGAHLDSSVYEVIGGLKTGEFLSSSGSTNSASRNTAAEYVAQSAAAQTLVWSGGTINYAKDAASKWITHNAIAQYWGPGYYYNASLRSSLAASFAGGRIKSATIDSAGNGTGISGNILNVAAGGVTAGTLDVGTQLFAPGIVGSSGITSPLTIAVMNGSAGCGSVCTGAGGSGTYQLNGNALVGNSSSPGLLNFIQSTSNTSAIQTFIDSSVYSSSFTGTVTNGSTAVVVAGSTGTITINSTAIGLGEGDFILDPSGADPNFSQFLSQSSGTTGGDGNYVLSKAWTGASGTFSMHSSGFASIGSILLAYTSAISFSHTFCNGDGSCTAPNSYQVQMRGYEGGYSPDDLNGGASQADVMQNMGKFVTSTPNSATGVQSYVTLAGTNFTGLGGQYPSLFQLNGLGPSGDDWSALPDFYVPGGSAYFNGYLNLP